MTKNSAVFIEHILECIKLIESYIEGKTEAEFLMSIPLQDQVIRRLEIIGEAVKNIPEKLRENYSDIPWKEIAGMRDIFIHEYFGIDLELTWEVVKSDIPDLKEKILKIKDKFKEEP